MQSVAKNKSPKPDDDDGKGKPNRSPSWTVYARLDPSLEGPTDAYINSREYPPALARVLERALKMLLKEEGFWPAGPDA